MAQYTAYANYVIFFSDTAEYDFALAIANGNYIELSPLDAATLFGISWPPDTGDMSSIPKGMYGFTPYGLGDPPVEVMHPGASGIFMRHDVASVLVPGQAGNPASIWPAGPDLNLVWSGTIAFSPTAQADPSNPVIPQRRWLMGFEIQQSGEGGATGNDSLCRDASRTIDGLGMACRGDKHLSSVRRNLNEYRTGLLTGDSWERFYVRLRNLPSTSSQIIWRCRSTVGNQGALIRITSAGALEAYDVSNGSAEQLMGTMTTLEIGVWIRIDLLIHYETGVGTTATFQAFVDGDRVIDYSDGSGHGLNGAANHGSSELGRPGGSPADALIEMDFDDWINADYPDPFDWENNVAPLDWFQGSHIYLHRSFSNVTHTDWTGNVGIADGLYNPASQQTDFVSTTSGAAIVGLTDVADPTAALQYGQGIIVGQVGANVAQFSRNSLGTDGEIGYSVAGGGPVMITALQTALNAFQNSAYLPSGITFPPAPAFAPFSVVKTKSLDAATDTTRGIQAIVENIGNWGREDRYAPFFDLDTSPPRVSVLHECLYKTTHWGYIGSRPDSPVYVVGGTYVGNGDYQEISLPMIAHYLYVRPTSAGTGGMICYAAALGAHTNDSKQVTPNLKMDGVGDAYWFSVSGTNADLNQLGVTYQYIAFCDPGMRFCVASAFSHGNNFTSPTSNILNQTLFLPLAAFVQLDDMTGTTTNSGLYYKGPGNAGTEITLLAGGVALADAADFSAGLFNSYQGLHIADLTTAQTNFICFRSTEDNCAGVMVQICTYTGDGAASQNVSLTPASGRFPLMVMVIPTASAGDAIMRDPSHSGNNSSRVQSGAIVTTGITAGAIDQITVGALLNTNGVVYNVFCFPGDSAGWNNGIFFNPTCEAPPGPWAPPPEEPEPGVNVIGEGGLILGGTTSQLVVQDMSGIYTLVPNKTDDTLIDRQTGQTSVDTEIPDPTFKTGYIGG